MDHSARWFLAGILVSLINASLVIVFIGVPDIAGIELGRGSGEVQIVEVAQPAQQFVIVVDEDGNVLSQRMELVATGAGASGATAPLLGAIEFGLPDACPPETTCDASDRLLPDTVVISPGDTLTFDINDGSHAIAVYGPGTAPGDIDVSPESLEDILRFNADGTPDLENADDLNSPQRVETDGLIVDPNGRVAQSPDGPFGANVPGTWTTPADTFAEPGQYLLICTFAPHFGVGMYGTVIVTEEGDVTTGVAPVVTRRYEAPVFAELVSPSYVAARDGVAYVATGQFELWRVDLDGEVEEESLDGIDDRGRSLLLDVDVVADGTLYALISDGPLEWRLFSRAMEADDWELTTSAGRAGWPADVVALSVAGTGTIYISAGDPGGVFRIEPDLKLVRQWVIGERVFGLDASADDSHLLYAVPQLSPDQPETQVGHVRAGRFGVWPSTYEDRESRCTDTALPQFARDVAIVSEAEGVALVVDSLNHVVRLQQQDGSGTALFGVPCESGGDDLHLWSPRAVAVDNDGNVFISDTANGRVVVLAASAGDGRLVALPAKVVLSEQAMTGSRTESVEFGLPELCPPETSCESADRLLPYTTTISAGDRIRFNINARSHQVAIFGPGTLAEDIDLESLGFPPGNEENPSLIADASALEVSPFAPLAIAEDEFAPYQWTSADGTFDQPGTYLVICTFKPHFDVGMIGQIIVE